MFSWLRKTRYGPIALDVGAEGFRMLQLCSRGGRLQVVAAGRWHAPVGDSAGLGETNSPACASASAEGAAQRDPAQVWRNPLMAQAVHGMLKNGGFRGRKVVTCIRTSQLAIKNIRLPHMSDEELDKALQWEAKERFEFPVSSDRLHFINTGEVRQGSEVRDELILMAVPEQPVAEQLEHLSAMKLSIEHMDVEPNALFRTYQRFLRRAEDASTVSVIIDVGLASTKVIVSRGTIILFIKAIDIAGRKFNESVAKELNLSYQDALRIRRGPQARAHASRMAGRGFPAPAMQPSHGRASAKAPGVRPAVQGASLWGKDSEPAPSAQPDQIQWSVYDAIRSQVEVLAREIGMCLRYCSVTFRGLRPSQLTLTGGEAYDPALTKLLGEYLDCPCVVGQPLNRIDLGEADEAGASRNPEGWVLGLDTDRRGTMTEWSVATGLALRGLFNPSTAGAVNGGEAEAQRGPDRVSEVQTTHERRRLSA